MTCGESLSRLTLQDVREFFDEGFEAYGQTIDVMRIAVVGYDCRNSCKQADSGGYQRFGNAGSDSRERGLLYIGQTAEGIHDAPYGAEQTDIRRNRTYRGEKGKMRFKGIHFTLISSTHGTA